MHASIQSCIKCTCSILSLLLVINLHFKHLLNSHVAPCGDAAFVDPAGQVEELCVVLFQRGGAVGVLHALGRDRIALAGVQNQQKNAQESQNLSERMRSRHQTISTCHVAFFICGFKKLIISCIISILLLWTTSQIVVIQKLMPK